MILYGKTNNVPNHQPVCIYTILQFHMIHGHPGVVESKDEMVSHPYWICVNVSVYVVPPNYIPWISASCIALRTGVLRRICKWGQRIIPLRCCDVLLLFLWQNLEEVRHERVLYHWILRYLDIVRFGKGHVKIYLYYVCMYICIYIYIYIYSIYIYICLIAHNYNVDLSEIYSLFAAM